MNLNKKILANKSFKNNFYMTAMFMFGRTGTQVL